jgi:hypothetical protein
VCQCGIPKGKAKQHEEKDENDVDVDVDDDGDDDKVLCEQARSFEFLRVQRTVCQREGVPLILVGNASYSRGRMGLPSEDIWNDQREKGAGQS